MKWIRIGFLVMFILLCIPRTVHAQEQGSVLFYEWDENGEAIDKKQNIVFLQNSNVETKARILFYALFHPRQEGKITYVPDGTELQDVEYHDQILILHCSLQAENCEGGEKERLFSHQIIKTAYSIKEIRGIIILVNGREIALPEGTEFF